MDLSYYVRALRRNAWLLVLVLLCCAGGAAAAAWLKTPLYTTSTTLVQTAGDNVTPAQEAATRQLVAQRASTLAQFATTAPVEEAVIESAARSTGMAPRVPESISASADGSSPFLAISVTDRSPQWAEAIANAYRDAMPSALAPIDPDVASTARQLSVLTPASLPQQPSSPNRTEYVLLGLLLGVVLGLGLVTLKEALDRQIREPEDVGRALAVPVLAAIPQEDSKRALPMRSAPHSARAEAYRAVLANLPFLNNPDDLPQQVMVTGTTSREGVTTLAANLAVALARSGRRVLLVDANLRNPRLHEVFDIPIAPGLSELLADAMPFENVVHVLDGGSLRVLTAGGLPEDPVERMTNAHATDVLAHLEKYCDVVIFDTPPVGPVADALFLVRQVSAVVLTTRMRLTRKDRLRLAGDTLHQVRAPVAGVVVNGTRGPVHRLRPSRRHAEAHARPLTPARPSSPALEPPGTAETGSAESPAES